MSDRPEVDLDRRRFLTKATAVVGAGGAAMAAYPFLASWMPSARARAAGAPVEVDISKLNPGERIVIEWRGKPVWIVYRTANGVENLIKVNDVLKDPHSENAEQQPEYAQNIHRSRKPQLLVMEGVCTHLGCSPLYQPEPTANLAQGGFYCPCHGSKFDLAGRVYAGVPAGANMKVPPYHFVSDTLVKIGEDGGAA